MEGPDGCAAAPVESGALPIASEALRGSGPNSFVMGNSGLSLVGLGPDPLALDGRGISGILLDASLSGFDGLNAEPRSG